MYDVGLLTMRRDLFTLCINFVNKSLKEVSLNYTFVSIFFQ